MTKKTKKDWYEEIMVVVENVEAEGFDNEGAIDFLTKERDLLVSQYDKAKAHRGMTKTQKENMVHKENIRTILVTEGKPMSATEIREKLMEYEEDTFSIPKVTALVSQMVKTGEVVRTEEKRKAFFALVTE